MRRIAAWALVLGATHGLAAQRLAKPVRDTVDHHIVRVTNPGPTSWSDTNGWKLTYERTIQPADDSPGMLEHPAGISLLGDGRLVEWDSKTPGINVYDVHGALVRKIGRDGEGPGEFRRNEVGLLRDTIVVDDIHLARITVFTIDGRLIRTMRAPCCDGFPVAVDQRGRAILHVTTNLRGAFTSHWARVPLGGGSADTIPSPVAAPPLQWTVHSEHGEAVFRVPFAGQTTMAFQQDGSMIYGATDRAEWLRSSDGRDTTLIIRISGLVPRPVPAVNRDSLFHLYTDHNEALRAVAHESDLPRTYPLWREIGTDDRGDFWIMLGSYFTPITGFAVVDRNGAFLGIVPSPFRAASYVSWSGDRVAVADIDDNDVPRVRIFRIDRRGH
ncbi:MAG TPA: hypothetical protein VGM20_12990 [Gemmatimonadales bacterium]